MSDEEGPAQRPPTQEELADMAARANGQGASQPSGVDWNQLPQVPLSPVPFWASWAGGEFQGKAAIVLFISTPTGITALTLSPEQARDVCEKGLTEVARHSSGLSGLYVPPPGTRFDPPSTSA